MKRFSFLVLFLSATLYGFSQTPDYVATDGLLGWWPFTGNANDFSGNGNNGSSTAALNSDRFGTASNAYSFNGQSFVDISPSTLGARGSGSFSVSAWFISGSNALLQNIARYSTCAGGSQDWGVRLHNGKVEVLENAPLNLVQTPLSYTDNQWHHVVYVRDALLLKQQIYVDGVLVVNQSIPSVANITSAPGSVFRFGSCAGYEYFVGGLDDFGFWNRSLTQAEVTSLYTTQPPIVYCEDESACNFGLEGACIYSNLVGCMNPLACNYDPTALCDDGSCLLTDGCTDEAACNYDPFAACDNGSCTFNIDCSGVCGGSYIFDLCGNCYDPNSPLLCAQGCTDPLACNYDSEALLDDGTCDFAPTLDLGADRSDCEGTSFILDAGAGFDSYMWSTGETTQSISVTASGNYSVSTTYGNTVVSNDYALNTTNSQWVSIPAFNTTPSYTLGAWVKFPIAGSGYRTLFQRETGLYHHILFDPSGRLGLFNAGFFGVNVFQQNLSPGYHHICIVASGNQTTFYVDGVSAGSVNSKITFPVQVIGNHTGDGTQPIGDFDNAMIWDIALSPLEIVEAMCPPQPGTPGLVAYYTFEEGGGSTVFDVSGNNRNGSRQGNASYITDAPETSCTGVCAANTDDVQVSVLTFGCTNPQACNYDSTAGCDDGSCVIPEQFNGFTLGADLTACEGDTVTLAVQGDFDAYSWSTGSTSNTIEVTQTGSYELTAAVALNGNGVSNLASGSFQTGQRATIPAWTPTSNYTMAAHVQFPLPSAMFNTLLMKDGGTYHHIIFQNGVLGVYNANFFSSGWNSASASPGFHHIAAVCSGNQTEFYVDGVWVGTSPTKVTQSIEVIGNFNDGTQRIGLADEVQLWSVALNAEQIQDAMQCRPEGTTPGLVGLWSMDEAQGNVVSDLTGNGRNATLVGGASLVSSAPELSCIDYCFISDTVEVVFEINGCTDPLACNYNENAGCDDGSCIIAPALELGEDLLVCEGDSVVLSPGSGFDFYIWNGSVGNETFTATATGTYEVVGVLGESVYVNEGGLRTTGINQHVAFPDITPTNEFTLTSWVKFPLPTAQGGWRTLFEKSGANDHHVIFDSNGALGLFTTQFFSTGFNVNTLTAGWHHVASVRNGSQTSFFIDGNLVGTVNAVVSNPVNRIGGHSATDQRIGWFDEASIWKRALTSSELLDLMNCPSLLNDPDLLAYYNFEETSGNSIFDISVNQWHGSLVNAQRSNDVPVSNCTVECTVTESVFIEFQPSGCTNDLACNYDPIAICDDGSCSILPVLDLGADLSFCGGDSVVIDAGAGFDYYIWSTGDSTQTITVSETAEISVIAGTGTPEVYSNSFGLQSNGVQYLSIPSWQPTPQNSLGAWVKFPLPSFGAPTEYNTLFERSAGTYHHIIFSPQGELGVYDYSDFYGCGLFESQITSGWHHVMAVAQNGQTAFFFDGEQVGVVNRAVQGNVEVIGSHTNVNDPQSIGKFDEVQIWSKALSAAEIQQYMTCPPTGDEQDLVAYFPCNEGSGSVIQNLRAGGINGTRQGVSFSNDTPQLTCLPACALTDTINVWQLGSGISPADTTICIGTSVELEMLDLPNPAAHNYSVLWSTSETTALIDVAPVFTQEYSITVFDDQTTCYDTVQVAVNNPLFTFDVDTLSYCNIDSLVIDGPVGFDAYLWSNGAETQNSTVFSSNLYTLTAFDEIGCSVSDSIRVSIVNAQLAQSDTTLCIGDSLTLTVLDLVEEENVVYFNDFSASAGGNWNRSELASITGQQTFGAFSNETVSFQMGNLPAHDSLIVELTVYALDSWDGNGQAGGEIWEMDVDGAPVVQTNFSSFADKSQCYPDNCPAANPWGTGSDLNLSPYCHPIAGKRYQIRRVVAHTNSSVSIDLSAMNLQVPICDESWAVDNFRVSVLSSSFNDLLWSNGSTDQSITVFPDSLTTYYVQISDGITTCIDSVSIGVSNPIPTFASDSLQVCGDEAFAISLEQPWPVYAWSTGETTDVIQITSTGLYQVEIADSLDCRASDSLFVYFTAMNIIQPDTAICIGGSVLLQVEDALPTIAWSTGESAAIINIAPLADTLIYASYPMALRNCTDSVLIRVSNMQPTFSTTNVSCFGLGDGTASAQVSGGLEPYTFNWVDSDPNALQPGSYEFILTDSIGCSFDTTYTIIQPLPLVAAAFSLPETCFGSGDATLSFTAAGGTAPYFSDYPNGTNVGYGPGEYIWFVADANGCEFEVNTEISASEEVCGCTYQEASNYNPLATVDDGSCITANDVLGCTDIGALNYMPSATIDDGSCLFDQNIYGCTYAGALNYDPAATADDGSCQFISSVLGCTDAMALNYMPSATDDDGSCLYDTNVYGCTYFGASNYNPQATADDGSCVLECEPISGCTDLLALNYMPSAIQDDGSCVYDGNIYGCTYASADNYNADATADNGSCEFAPEIDPCPADLNNDGIINSGDLLLFLGAFGTVCE